jgi:hypothetical protein
VRYNLLILFLLSSLVSFPLAPIPVYAHPGRTDSSGGHTCRTNCESWGLGYGEYHSHGGGGSSGGSTGSTYTAPVMDTQQQQPVAVIPTNTPLPLRIPTRIPTKMPTPTVTLTPSPMATPSPTTSQMKKARPIQANTQAPKQQGFFEWLFSLFGSK